MDGLSGLIADEWVIFWGGAMVNSWYVGVWWVVGCVSRWLVVGCIRRWWMYYSGFLCGGWRSRLMTGGSVVDS